MEEGGQLDLLCPESAKVVRNLIKDCRIPVEFVRVEAEERYPDEERGEHNRAAFHRARRLATKGADDSERWGTERDQYGRRRLEKKNGKRRESCNEVAKEHEEMAKTAEAGHGDTRTRTGEARTAIGGLKGRKRKGRTAIARLMPRQRHRGPATPIATLCPRAHHSCLCCCREQPSLQCCVVRRLAGGAPCRRRRRRGIASSLSCPCSPRRCRR